MKNYKLEHLTSKTDFLKTDWKRSMINTRAYNQQLWFEVNHRRIWAHRWQGEVYHWEEWMLWKQQEKFMQYTWNLLYHKKEVWQLLARLAAAGWLVRALPYRAATVTEINSLLFHHKIPGGRSFWQHPTWWKWYQNACRHQLEAPTLEAGARWLHRVVGIFSNRLRELRSCERFSRLWISLRWGWPWSATIKIRKSYRI